MINDSNKFITTQIQEWLSSQDEERRAKTSFWATDCEKPVFDLYHKWIGTPETNPIEAEKLMMFNAAKMMEISLVETLEKMGEIVVPENEDQHYCRMEREGIEVSGKLDAMLKDGTPVEVKTFYGDYQARELKAGNPRSSYLKQLAVYMDYLNKDKGFLIYIDRGTGEMYQFVLERVEGLRFKCMSVEFDLTDTYRRWARLYKCNIVPKIEPKSEFKYKYDIETLDWSEVSKSDISKARNGHKVIGDWEVSYSSYKNLIIEREGTCLGYTAQELERIKELTKGYSSKI